MVFEFLTQIYFGNTLAQYGYFLLGVMLFFVIGKIISFIFETTLTRLAKGTKNTLDDFLIDALKKPLIGLVVIIGSYISLIFFLTLDEGMRRFVDGAYVIIVVIFIAWLLTKIITAFMDNIVKPIVQKSESRLDDQILPIISKTLKVIVWILAGITIAGHLGYDITTILAGLGIGGLAFAFAAQKTVADIFGGISILVSKPFLVGDIIEAEGVIGIVEEISLRNTRIRDFDGRRITMPNSNLSSKNIKNISSEPAKKILANLGLTYGTSSKKVKQAIEILKKIVNKQKGCKKEPAVYFTEFKDFSLNLMLIYYIEDKKNWFNIRHEVNMKIKEEFDKAKIDFAFPTQTVYMKK